MLSTPDHSTAAGAPRWWDRVRQGLTPASRPRGVAYWWLMTLAGLLILGHALAEVADLRPADRLQVAAGVALAMAAGLFPIRIPRTKDSFAAGEVFIFLLLLLHGPGAACLAAAGEAFVARCRTTPRWPVRIVSPAIAAVAIMLAGLWLREVLQWLSTLMPVGAGIVLGVTVLFSTAYFVVNTLLNSLVSAFERDERLSLSGLLGGFGFVAITYWGCATLAALLYLSSQQAGMGVVMATVPVIAMLVATLHFYVRQQAADEVVRRSREEAAEREAEQSARHVHQLHESERRFHSAFTHASIGMLLVTFDGTVLQTNIALRTLLGGPDDPPTPARVADVVHPDDEGELWKLLHGLSAGRTENGAMELRCRRTDGSDVWVSLYASFFSDARSSEPSLILQVQDISARRHAEARLEMIAFHDPLTGLPNRARLMELLGHALAAANSDPGRHFAVLFLDFDRFKLINDSFGHAAGDRFLNLVSQRLQHQVRPGDVVARLGGDEFVVLVQKVDDESLVIGLAERLQQAIARPFSIAGTEVITSASIGITFSRFGYESPGDILRDADIAMYRAKAEGKARHAVYDVALHAQIVQRVRIESELRSALATRALEVHYQAIYDLESRTPVAFEALLRWEHPEMGLIAPAVFVPIAEETGLITQLTDFVLAEACARLSRWVTSDPTMAEVSLHVNLSGVDLAQPQLPQRVLEVLTRHRLKPQQLVLELSENILMRHLESSRERLAMLNQLGVGLSVDDFGTGYASLSHLTTLPVHSLKIDRSFVDRIGQGGPSPEFLRAVVMLGRSLGMTVVAEGIETERQCAELHAIGCDRGQGYLLSRPMTAGDIEEALIGLPQSWHATAHSHFISGPGTLQ